MPGTERIKLVVDIATDRIIWFGPTDFPLEETHIEGAAVAYCDGPIPVGMRASNSWSYKLVNQKIVAPVPKAMQATESPLEASRLLIVKQVNQSIDKYRAANGVPQTIAEYMLADAELLHRATKVTKLSEETRFRYISCVRTASNSSQLVNIVAELNRELNEIKT